MGTSVSIHVEFQQGIVRFQYIWHFQLYANAELPTRGAAFSLFCLFGVNLIEPYEGLCVYIAH